MIKPINRKKKTREQYAAELLAEVEKVNDRVSEILTQENAGVAMLVAVHCVKSALLSILEGSGGGENQVLYTALVESMENLFSHVGNTVIDELIQEDNKS